MTPVVETVAPVKPVKPVDETPTEADSTVAAVADVGKVDWILASGLPSHVILAGDGDGIE